MILSEVVSPSSRRLPKKKKRVDLQDFCMNHPNFPKPHKFVGDVVLSENVNRGGVEKFVSRIFLIVSEIFFIQQKCLPPQMHPTAW